jgi:hypothetical protein
MAVGQSPHYHLIDNTIGRPLNYRDDIFLTRREAEAAAKARADWLATSCGLHVERLTGLGRYYVSGHEPRAAGQVLEVEACDDPECLLVEAGPKLLSVDRPLGWRSSERVEIRG